MDTVIADNGAGGLMLSFFDWGYKTPAASKAGTKRRFAREKANTAFRMALYANTSNPPGLASRQVLRRAAILKAKKMSDRKHGWRDQFETLRRTAW